MPIQEAIFDYTAAVAGVTALLGSGEDCKLFWQDAPVDQQPPYATFTISVEVQFHRFGGNPTVSELTIAVQSFATEPQDARAIDASIYSAWMGHAASITDVKAILHANRGEASYSEMANLFSVETTYKFWVDL